MKTLSLPAVSSKVGNRLTTHTVDNRTMDYLASLTSQHGKPGANSVCLALYRSLMGAESFDNAPKIDPCAVVIPQHQWDELANLIHPLDVMQWINISPSAA